MISHLQLWEKSTKTEHHSFIRSDHQDGIGMIQLMKEAFIG